MKLTSQCQRVDHRSTMHHAAMAWDGTAGLLLNLTTEQGYATMFYISVAQGYSSWRVCWELSGIECVIASQRRLSPGMGGYRDTTASIKEGKHYDHASDQALVAQIICAVVAPSISGCVFCLCGSTSERGANAGNHLLFFFKRPGSSTRGGSSHRGKRARGCHLLYHRRVAQSYAQGAALVSGKWKRGPARRAYRTRAGNGGQQRRA